MVSRPKAALCPLSAAILLAISSPAFSASFTVEDGETVDIQVLNEGETGTIKVGGTVSSGGTAVVIMGSNTTLNNAGTISNQSSLQDVIAVLPSNLSNISIFNSGTILGQFAMNLGNASDSQFINSGLVRVTQDNGITSTGHNNTFLNTGRMEISLGSSSVFNITNANNIRIENQGEIEASNIAYARGIFTSGNNHLILNSGSILTYGQYSEAISTSATNSLIDNSGTITTRNAESHGIESTGTNNQIINSGSINTHGGESQGIESTGANNQILNSGTINTAGDYAFGIRSTGSNAAILNTGDITTTGLQGVGIVAEGEDAAIQNDGNITTSGIYAFGIISLNDNANIINNGKISTSGDSATGIVSQEINATIINNGSIDTQGEDAHGIHASGDNANVINNGTITTADEDASGIYSSASNATLINNGNIYTSWYDAVGIRSTGDDAIIKNFGTIITNDEEAYGISSSGDNANIYNAGTIISNGGWSSYAIFSEGDNANIVNDGNIFTTENNEAIGIVSEGDNVNITNNGNIITSGYYGHGILVGGNDTIINNNGLIATSGDFAHGVVIFGEGTALNNQGSIITTGYNASTIRAEDDYITINNSGFISATGEDSYAILGSPFSMETTVNLLPGSQIIGAIDLGETGDNDTVNIYGGSVSAALTMDNVENINVFGNGVLIGNTTITDGQTTSTRAQVVTVDPTGESARSVALSGMTSSIHGVINQRMNHAAPLKPVQLASLELSDGMYFEEQRPVAWSQVFGGTMDRDATGSAMAYGYDHAGINFGYEWDMAGHRVGVLGGLVRGKTESELASFETESDNYYVGAYANRKAYGLNITGSLLAGYGDNDNDRLVVDNLNGFETASADFSSWFISPGVSIGSAFDIADRLEFRPSVSVNYSIAWLDSYTEKGTTNANLSVDDRKLQALTARAQLAAAYQLSDTSEFELRAGVNSRHTNDDDTKVGIAGSQFRFANAGDESVTGGFAGAALRVMNDNNFTLIADVEFGGNSDEDYAAGSLTLQYAF